MVVRNLLSRTYVAVLESGVESDLLVFMLRIGATMVEWAAKSSACFRKACLLTNNSPELYYELLL